MRILILFALALFGTAVLTADASAFGKRGRGQSSCGSSGCGGTVSSSCGSSGCGTSSCHVASSCGSGGCSTSSGHVGYSCGSGGCSTSSAHVGYSCGSGGCSISSGHVVSAPGASGHVVQATNGQFYTQGADGYYRASAPGTSLGSNSAQNVSPAGYSGPSGNVYQAGGALTMPTPRR